VKPETVAVPANTADSARRTGRTASPSTMPLASICAFAPPPGTVDAPEPVIWKPPSTTALPLTTITSVPSTPAKANTPGLAISPV